MSEETDAFRDFWTIWKPHMNPNDGRGEARDVFFEEVECFGADPAAIVDGARWYIHRGGNQGVDFSGRPVKSLAASWLRKRQYEDGADEWRAYQKRLSDRQAQAENVVPIRAQLPENHFSRLWERGEVKAGE